MASKLFCLKKGPQAGLSIRNYARRWLGFRESIHKKIKVNRDVLHGVATNL
jgi:hypothetical protein